MANDPPKAKWLLVISVYLALMSVSYIGFVGAKKCKCENLKKTNFRMVNGRPLLERGLPWVGFVFYKEQVNNIERTQLRCTATVISRLWVLTGKQRPLT